MKVHVTIMIDDARLARLKELARLESERTQVRHTWASLTRLSIDRFLSNRDGATS
jgi:hypothetical protein